MSKGFTILLVFIFSFGRAVADESSPISLEDFLAADTLKQIGIRQQDLEKVTYQLLEGSVSRAPDLAGKILPHAQSLIRHEQLNNGGWFQSMWNGWTHTGGWFQSYLRAHAELETLGIAVRTFRENRSGTIAHSGYVGRNQSDAIVAAYNAGGGNYRPGPGMQRLAEELLAVCGSGESPFLIPDFFKFNYQLRPAQRRAALKWAAQVEKTDPLYHIADACLVGTALLEIEFNRKLGPNPFSREEALERAVQILKDDTLSLAWRGGFATFLGNESPDRWGDDLGIVVGNLIAEILETETPYAYSSFSNAFPLFLRSDNTKPEWQETGRRFLKSWEKRNRLNKTSKRVGRAFDPNNYWIVPVIDLACRLRDQKTIDSLLSSFSSGIHVAPGAIIHLISDRYYREARKLLLTEVEKREYSKYQYSRESVYNIRLHKEIPAFLETIESRIDRDFAALHLAAILDPQPFPRDAGFPNREDRLRDLLKRGPPELAASGLKKKRTLEILSLAARNPVAMELLNEHAPLMGPSEDDNKENLGPYWGTRAAIFSDLEALENGIDPPLRFQLGRAAFDESPWFSGNRRRVCNGLLIQMTMRLETAYLERDIARIQSFLPIGRLIAESVPLTTRPHSFLIYLTGAHALADEMPAFERWWVTLDDPRKKEFANLLVEQGAYITYNGNHINPLRELPEIAFESTDARRRYMKDLLSNPWTDCGYHDRNSLAYSESRALLTEDDIYFLAEPLAKKWPRRGCAHREWFGSLADRGRHGEALELVDKKYPGQDEDHYFTECLLWEQTLLHEAMGNEAKAEETLLMLQKQTKKSGFRMKGYDRAILSIIEKRLGVDSLTKKLAPPKEEG